MGKLVIIFLLFFFNSVTASPWETSGSIKYQFVNTLYQSDDLAALGKDRNQYSNTLTTRLMSRYQKKTFEFSIDYDVLGNASSSFTSQDQTSVFDLQRTEVNREKINVSHRIDRLYVGYVGDQWVHRVGRQAISWGNGFMFNPLDIFNPFSQTAIDKEYKSGDDLLYSQFLMDSGNDWQFVAVPRRNILTQDIEMAQSSIALKYKAFSSIAVIDYLAAQHYDEQVIGIGVVKSIADSIWRIDATVTVLQDGNGEDSYALQIVNNMDYSWSLFDHNMYGYIEYYYNSIGVETFSDISGSQLEARIQRSELFTVGRRYVSAGVTLETSALTSLFLSMIVNASDKSLLIPLAYNYNWKQNVNLMIGANLTLGERDTEYGGYQQLPGLYGGLGQSAYALLSYYF